MVLILTSRFFCSFEDGIFWLGANSTIEIYSFPGTGQQNVNYQNQDYRATNTFVIHKDVAVESLLKNIDVVLVDEVNIGRTECITIERWVSLDKPWSGESGYIC